MWSRACGRRPPEPRQPRRYPAFMRTYLPSLPTPSLPPSPTENQAAAGLSCTHSNVRRANFLTRSGDKPTFASRPTEIGSKEDTSGIRPPPARTAGRSRIGRSVRDDLPWRRRAPAPPPYACCVNTCTLASPSNLQLLVLSPGRGQGPGGLGRPARRRQPYFHFVTESGHGDVSSAR